MRVLFVSTYDLGHQPLALAALAGAASAAGHEVRCTDLAVEELDGRDAAWAEAAVFSVPMHTALRLALGVVERLRNGREDLAVALCGLYAPVADGHRVIQAGDLLVAGEAAAPLLSWLERGDPTGLVTELGPVHLPAGAPPLRALLPPLARYARLVDGTGRISVAAGSTATTTGCNHRCRHCPVAAVYGGRSRVVDAEAVLADVAALVDAGAGHVSFADPDFLNRPRHSLAVARAVQAAWPGLTFDATVKVEHVLRHEELFGELGRLGLRFVVSAFESTDDAVLALLDKGHVQADETEAVRILRSSGIETHPSWLPFTPWTTHASVAELLRFTAEQDLVWNTDTVQFAIRLLLPKGSLLLEEPDPVLASSLDGLDPETGSVAWHHADGRLDDLQAAVAGVAEEAAGAEAGPTEAFAAVWATCRSHGVPLPPEVPEPVATSPVPGPDRLRLSEAWFCCAEPTAAQLVSAGASL